MTEWRKPALRYQSNQTVRWYKPSPKDEAAEMKQTV